MINDIDSIISKSILYIADVTHNSKVDVMETWIKAYTKQQDKHCARTKKVFITLDQEDKLKLYALNITGRYYRAHNHGLNWHPEDEYGRLNRPGGGGW